MFQQNNGQSPHRSHKEGKGRKRKGIQAEFSFGERDAIARKQANSHSSCFWSFIYDIGIILGFKRLGYVWKTVFPQLGLTSVVGFI
ncbi:hypothetical protein AAHA92_28935 [Salvia divinorum]|uniref:Uncharacterized protein n=1 Tax=Salvia divinorum TaxID=28513 RepID=A0ABD1FWQ3_SALDI